MYNFRDKPYSSEIIYILACVASVSVGFRSKLKKSEERDFWCFACAENGARARTRSIFRAAILCSRTETLATQAI